MAVSPSFLTTPYVPLLKYVHAVDADNLPQIKEELSSNKGVAVAALPCKHALKGFIWPNKTQKLSHTKSMGVLH